MKDKEKIRNIIELFIAWNGETEAIDIANLDSAIDFIADSLQEEPVRSNIDFEQELYKAFGQVKDFTLGMQIAKRFYDMGKNSKDSQELVSIWHDTCENPKEEEYLICVYKDNRSHIGKIYKDEFGRLLVSDNKNIIELCMFEKWAYLDDVINLSNVQRTTKNWKEIPVSEDLEEAAENAIEDLEQKLTNVTLDEVVRNWLRCMFRAGAQWQKEQFEKDYTNLCNGIATVKGIAVTMAYDKGVADTKEQMMKNIWKPADGDDLPEIDREVIALLDNGTVVFAHRPPEFWDGKNIAIGKITRYYPKTYDKGCWNIPNVKFWLDVELPKEIEL